VEESADIRSCRHDALHTFRQECVAR
jgi:hypothetical protein